MRLNLGIAAVVTFSLTATARAPDAGTPRAAVTKRRAVKAPDAGTPGTATTVKVHGRATFEAHYCGGGAAATEEMIRAAERNTPLPNVAYRANLGHQIDLAAETISFTTGADATFTVNLPKGTWCVYAASRTPVVSDDAEPRALRGDSNIDADCLEREKVRCDLVFEVGAQPVEANIQISKGCPEQWNQPCWIGPMPP
jgi:hypothetical protein